MLSLMSDQPASFLALSWHVLASRMMLQSMVPANLVMAICKTAQSILHLTFLGNFFEMCPQSLMKACQQNWFDSFATDALPGTSN